MDTDTNGGPRTSRSTQGRQGPTRELGNMTMALLQIGFPAALDNIVSPLEAVAKTPERRACSSIPDWLSCCQIVKPPARAIDLLVIYAHARLSTYAFRQDCEGIE